MKVTSLLTAKQSYLLLEEMWPRVPSVGEWWQWG